MHEGVLFFTIVGIGSIVAGAISGAITSHLLRNRDKRFLRFVRVTNPQAKVIEVISVASSDKQALENIERRIRNASRTL
jgi:hypothetical protein